MGCGRDEQGNAVGDKEHRKRFAGHNGYTARYQRSMGKAREHAGEAEQGKRFSGHNRYTARYQRLIGEAREHAGYAGSRKQFARDNVFAARPPSGDASLPDCFLFRSLRDEDVGGFHFQPLPRFALTARRLAGFP